MYLTRWVKLRKDGTVHKGEYRTQERTPVHDRTHDTCDYAVSGPEKGMFHFMERMTKTPKWKAHCERKEEERKTKEVDRQRVRDAAYAMLSALQKYVDDMDYGRGIQNDTVNAARAAVKMAKGG